MMSIKGIFKRIFKNDLNNQVLQEYYKRFSRNAFHTGHCENVAQYEACITRLYHTVEKGLSYEDYRPGFGCNNVSALISTMETYSEAYGCDSEFYATALDVLQKYVKKNREYGYVDTSTEEHIKDLKGDPNGKGGIISFEPWSKEKIQSSNYAEFVKNRHSIRHFSEESVALSGIIDALDLAQFTPSACNRQGWKTYIVVDKEMIEKVLQNQNGNRGFGQEINKLLLITADLCFFNYERELFQAYIDGGMYAMSVINSLHFEHIGTIPLSASLTQEQEKNVRTLLKMKDSEVFILFIGMGAYPRRCQTTKSDRHKPTYEII